MKNKLFVLLLAIVAYPLFANAKINNAKLLAHLKSVRTEFTSIIDQNETIEINQFSEQELRQVKFLKNVVQEFYNKAEALQKIITEEFARPEFEIICNNIEPFDVISHKIFDFDRENIDRLLRMQNPDQSAKPVCICGDPVACFCYDMQQYPVAIDTQFKKELFEIFKSVFVKLCQELIKNNIFGEATIDEVTTDEVIEYYFIPILSQLLWQPQGLGKDYPLLKLLDAKITELEVQV